MIIVLTFSILSLLILIVLGIVAGITNKNRYTEKVRNELVKLGYTLISIESEEPFDVDDKTPSFMYNYGSSKFFKIFKKVSFYTSSNQISTAYVIIELFFFVIKSVKIFSSDKKTSLT